MARKPRFKATVLAVIEVQDELVARFVLIDRERGGYAIRTIFKDGWILTDMAAETRDLADRMLEAAASQYTVVNVANPFTAA